LFARLLCMHDTANLGGDDEFVPGALPQEMPQAQFTSPITIKGRGIKEAHTALPSGLQQRLAFSFGDGGTKAANGRGAKAELCDAERCGANAAGGDVFHGVLPDALLARRCLARWLGPQNGPSQIIHHAKADME
jgi:hypothetical protein